MALKAGKIKKGTDETDLWTGSMAEAIETAFNVEWERVLGTKPPETNDQIRLLYVAIAQGVVQHLYKNPDAFKLKTNDVGAHQHKIKFEINPNTTKYEPITIDDEEKYDGRHHHEDSLEKIEIVDH